MEDLTGQVDTVDSISAAEWNNHYQEFKNLITPFASMSSGDLQQINKAISNLVHRTNFYTDGGSANVYTVTALGGMTPATSLGTGLEVRFRPANANTGGSTMQISGLGTARPLVREDNSALQANDMVTTRDALVRYNATTARWHLMNSALGAPVAPLPNGFIKGLTMGRNPGEHSAAPTQFRDVSVQPGRCRDTGNTMDMVLSSALAKRFDAAVSSGTGAAQGGFPAGIGSRTVNTWYRMFLIGQTSNGAVDAGFDLATAANAANLIADYNTQHSASMNAYRQIGWVRTTAGSNLELVPFLNDPNDPSTFLWMTDDAMIEDILGGTQLTTGLSTVRTFASSYAPPDSIQLLDWWGYNKANSGNSDIAGIAYPTTHPDQAPTQRLWQFFAHNPGGSAGTSTTPFTQDEAEALGSTQTRLNSSREFKVRFWCSEPNGYPYAVARGFVYER